MEQPRLDAIRARCEAATPGLWYEHEKWMIYEHEKWMIHTESNIQKNGIPRNKVIGTVDASCATFIAHAREDIPYLLDEVERLTAELEAAKRDMRKDCETCKFAENPANVPPCEMCGWHHDEFLGMSGWQWRGLCAENGGAE